MQVFNRNNITLIRYVMIGSIATFNHKPNDIEFSNFRSPWGLQQLANPVLNSKVYNSLT